MTIDDYRVRFGWSKAHMAQEAGIDTNTLSNAIKGKRIYRAKVGLVAEAVNRELARRNEPRIVYTDFEGVQFAD
ncbi:MAG: XRE family transcriptional regulator [Chloroflexota bacterium]|nr:XRE family transcriptional regulator [Chloroflexota bacterium]